MSSRQPCISIVVPTKDRPNQLRTCLESLSQLDYSRDNFEVIVVNDGGTCPLDPVVDPFRNALNLTILTQPNAGPASARNTGASQARGKYLAFTDDDCRPASNWLRAICKCLARHPRCMVGGHTVNVLAHNPFAIASQQLISYLYRYYNLNPEKARFLASNNIVIPTDLFEQIGGFDTTFPLAAGEDRELCDRWIYHGYQIIYSREPVVYHSHSLTLRKFWRQHFNYGRGAYWFHRLHNQRRDLRVTVEPLSFYLNLLRFPLSEDHGWRRWLHAGLMGGSQLANALGYYWECLIQRAGHQSSRCSTDTPT